MSGHPKLHRESMWYATDDDAVLGVVILDLVDKDYSWVVLTQSGQAGYTTSDMGVSLPTEDDATAVLHDVMRLARGNRELAPRTTAGDSARAEMLSRDHIMRAAAIFVQRLQASQDASEREMRERPTRRIR
jgi:hypothetical protein